MIGRLSGIIVEKNDASVILEVQGVGYTVLAPQLSLNSCRVEQEKTFHIYTSVREDAITLFGFDQKSDKQLFEKLITVSGVGPKLGMAILSTYKSEDIIKAIASQDYKFFTTVSGIGQKNAQRIILELKNKVDLTNMTTNTGQATANHELQQALESLGYDAKEVYSMTKGVDSNLSIEDQLKQALVKRK